ncbi:MAG: hypothetical protein QI223_05490 [Candidatus Korarchaeota archaeon]|nr:hypothetical protein [Candidatus Korarchaeota archaeon]
MLRAVVLAAVVVAAAFLIAYAFAIRESGGERVLLRYRRVGGIAGVSEELVVYEDGRAVMGGGGLSAGAKLPDGLVAALKTVFERIGETGVQGPPPTPGAADYFTHLVEAPGLGVNVSWVDLWASGNEVPDEIVALDALLSFARAYLLGWEPQHAARLAVGDLTVEVWIDRPWISPGDQITVRVEARNSEQEALAYERPTPCHPDFRIEVEGGGADVSYVQPAYDPRKPCIQVISRREIPPGGSVVNSAVVTVGEPPGRILWVRVSFAYPPQEPLTVRLPLVVTG